MPRSLEMHKETKFRILKCLMKSSNSRLPIKSTASMAFLEGQLQFLRLNCCCCGHHDEMKMVVLHAWSYQDGSRDLCLWARSQKRIWPPQMQTCKMCKLPVYSASYRWHFWKSTQVHQDFIFQIRKVHSLQSRKQAIIYSMVKMH